MRACLAPLFMCALPERHDWTAWHAFCNLRSAAVGIGGAEGDGVLEVEVEAAVRRGAPDRNADCSSSEANSAHSKSAAPIEMTLDVHVLKASQALHLPAVAQSPYLAVEGSQSVTMDLMLQNIWSCCGEEAQQQK